MRRKTLASFHVLILVSIAFFHIACNREKPAWVAEQNQTIEMPDQEGWNSTVTATKEGRVEAVVKYGHMMRFSEKKFAKFDQGVTVDFYQPDGRHGSLLTAERGELNETTNDVAAMGNVVVVSDTGVTLHTERLAYSQKNGKIFTEEKVMITTTDGDTLYGTGFESDPNLEHYTIKKVHGKAHAGVDLSTDRWEKKKQVSPDSSGPTTGSNDAAIRDSLNRSAVRDSLK